MLPLKYYDETLGLTGRRVLLARVISRVVPAPFVNLYVTVIMSYFPPKSLGPYLSPLSIVLVCLVFMVVLPLSPIVFQAWRGKVDLDVSAREMRLRFFVFSLVCYTFAYVIYWLFQCSLMSVLAAAYFGVTLAVMISTLRTKVSVHAAGVGGPGTALLYVYGMLAVPVLVLWVAVVWARAYLKQHTLVQSVAGLAIGAIVTYFVYAFLYTS
ncbi:MAG: hypothetical protein C4K49_05415 [Candidatus Thorarchaeota archaeon]|nr:MAG: hypothetical protein C4K49_05415 [Candidatus Thorarchaeota archaeon]